MKVFIFTEGGLSNGLGHITRCCSLYDELSERNIKATIVINSMLDHSNVLIGRDHIYFDWTLESNLQTLCFDEVISIVDSYNSSKIVYEYISDKSLKVLFIDDVNRIEYPKGIVLNPSLYTDDHEYSRNPDLKYLLGKEYLILRGAFRESTERKKIKKELNEILITLGGTDIRRLLPTILSVMRSYPKVKKNIVIGIMKTNENELLEFFDENTQVFSNVDELEMKELMQKSDLAISATGQTIYELLSVGTPFIPIQVIENQKYTVKGLKKYKLVNNMLNWDDSDLPTKLKKEIDFFHKYENRKKFNQKYKEIIDLNGVTRIIAELLK
ncbi:PseG/SpsG family protein [Exiguobacterium aurantiacum]|uniref:PseG/SpsG family protein n=1 Tax=Exiguobacterium aurantiacum TaxID=33987 RepID=UPI00384C6BA5